MSTHNWRASLKKFSKFFKVDSKFYSFSFSLSISVVFVIGHILACVCEVQLRLCVNFVHGFDSGTNVKLFGKFICLANYSVKFRGTWHSGKAFYL